MRIVNIFLMMVIISILSTSLSVHATGEQTHIYIDLWKNKLYLMEGNKTIEVFPISPGTDEKQTPIGEFCIIDKSRNWGGGFGTRWLGLNVPWGTYGIHGTNKPWLLGTNVSSGCIRMKNKDIEKLYDLIPLQTPVHIDGPIMGNGDAEYKRLSKDSKGILVYMVQMRLKAAGYYKGQCNGIFDTKTEEAIKSFQKDEGIPITGRISMREYMRLGLLE